MKFLVASILMGASFLHAAEPVPNPLIDPAQWPKIAHEVERTQSKRRLTLAQFAAKATQPGTVIIDTREAERFARRHVRGAVSLPSANFTAEALAKVILAKDTRVLFYSDSNFPGTPVAGLGTAVRPYKSIFFALTTYGYTDLYELGPILDVEKPGPVQFAPPPPGRSAILHCVPAPPAPPGTAFRMTAGLGALPRGGRPCGSA